MLEKPKFPQINAILEQCPASLRMFPCSLKRLLGFYIPTPCFPLHEMYVLLLNFLSLFCYRQGLKLRQLTDGSHFIQLIYTFDNKLQDCEYIKEKTAVRKFLETFKNEVEKAKSISGNKIERGNEIFDDFSENNEDYMEEDEGKIEKYKEEAEEEVEGEKEEEFSENEYRNVTFKIIRTYDDLPKELSGWMNYTLLKNKCSENHKMLKQLTHDKYHGDEKSKKLAEERLER